MAKETDKDQPEAKPAEGETTNISVASVQAECESFIQEKLNDVAVTPADLQRVLHLVHKLTKLIPAAAA